MNEGDRLHGSGDAGVAGSKPTEVGGEAGKDVQVAFLKSPVGEEGTAITVTGSCGGRSSGRGNSGTIIRWKAILRRRRRRPPADGADES